MKKTNFSQNAILLVALLALFPVAGLAATSVTGAGGGVFAGAASYNGIPLSGAQFGFGVDLDAGAASGDFQMLLLTVSGRSISVTARPTGGSANEAGDITLSGLCAVSAADQNIAEADVPFTLTVGRSEDGKSTLRLTLKTAELPAIAVSAGNVAVE